MTRLFNKMTDLMTEWERNCVDQEWDEADSNYDEMQELVNEIHETCLTWAEE